MLDFLKYQKEIKPFFQSQFQHLDKIIGKQPLTNNGGQGVGNKQLMVFVIESIGFLLEQVNDRVQEQKVLKSFTIHYDNLQEEERKAMQSDAVVQTDPLPTSDAFVMTEGPTPEQIADSVHLQYQALSQYQDEVGDIE